jgi:hypothetical protein
MKDKNFEIGDLVKLKMSDTNWNNDMDHFHLKIVEIKKILNNDNITIIKFDGDEGWEFVYEDGHFELYEKVKPVVNKYSSIDDEISYQELLLQNMNKESKFSDIDIDVKTGFITQKSKEIIPNIEGIKPKRKKVEYQSITIKLNNKF